MSLSCTPSLARAKSSPEGMPTVPFYTRSLEGGNDHAPGENCQIER